MKEILYAIVTVCCIIFIEFCNSIVRVVDYNTKKIVNKEEKIRKQAPLPVALLLLHLHLF